MSDVGITIHGNETVTNAGQKAGGALNRLEQTSKKTASSIGLSWKDAALAIGAAYLAFNRIKSVVDSLLGAYDKQLQAETKLSSALKATGNVAQFTERQLKNMAREMQDLTTFSDEAVLEAQAIMLTFKNIGHDVFPRAMNAAADLSAMFGQDLTNSTIMLAKALNEPTKGINAMRRVGVSFSAEAVEMVARLEEMGDIAAAQAIILKEVEGQVKGTAAAFAQMGTGPLRQLENKFGDLKEEMGKALLEGLRPLFEEMNSFIDFLAENISVLRDIGAAIAGAGKIILGVIKFVIQFREVIITLLVVLKVVPVVVKELTAIFSVFGVSSASLLGPIGLLVAALGVLIATIVSLHNRAKETERQINEMTKAIDRDFDLIKGAQQGSLKSLDEYYEAQSLVEKKIAEIRSAMEKYGDEHRAMYERMLARQQAVLESVNANIEAEKERQLVLSALQGTLADYSQYAEAIELQNQRIAEWEARLVSASKVEKKAISEWLAGQYKVLASLKLRQQEAYKETEEYKQMMAERTKIEEEYADKVFQLSASRLDVLAREEAEVVKQARKVGADLTNIKEYFSLQRIKIIEEEARAEAEALLGFIKERESQEQAAFSFLNEWAGKAAADRIALLEREKDATLEAADKMYEALKQAYGPGLVEDIAAGRDTIIDDEAEVREIENFIALYKKAISEIRTEYADKISQAQEEAGLLQQLGGERGVELYREMLGLSQSLADPMEKQKQELEGQRDLLIELQGLLPSDISRLTDFRKEVAENIPGLLAKIQERLRELADQPFVEIAQQVAGITERFKDPVTKAREAIEKDIETVNLYLKAITEKRSLYETEQDYLNQWGDELDATGELLAKLRAELAGAEKEITGSRDIASFWDLLTESVFSIYDDFVESAYSKYGELTGRDAGSLSPEEQDTAVAFAAAADAGSFLAGILVDLAGWFLDLILSTEAFQTFLQDLNEALASIVEFAANPLIEALTPLVQVVLKLVGIVATYVVPIFQMLGLLIKNLEPLWAALGNILLALLNIVLQLAPIIFFVAQIIAQNLTPIINILTNALGVFGEIISALQPVFDILGYVVDAVSRVFNSLWTIADFLLSPFRALGELLVYIITFQWDKIGSIRVTTPGELMESLAEIWNRSWSLGAYQDFLPEAGTLGTLEVRSPDDLEGLTPTVYGGNVSVQRAPDIYIYQYFQAPVIGPWGPVQVGEYVVAAISEYTNVGGVIPWEEA